LPPKIFVTNKQKDLALSPSSVRSVTKEVLLLEKRTTNQVSIHFVTQKKISGLHREFFNDPSPTDCISFPIDQKAEENYHVLGEVFISPKVAINYLAEKASSCIYFETTLYLVHGLLHLLGYDDIKKEERRKMRYREKKLMQHLANKNILISY